MTFPVLLTQAKQNHHEKENQKENQPFLCWASALHLISTFHALLMLQVIIEGSSVVIFIRQKSQQSGYLAAISKEK